MGLVGPAGEGLVVMFLVVPCHSPQAPTLSFQVFSQALLMHEMVLGASFPLELPVVRVHSGDARDAWPGEPPRPPGPSLKLERKAGGDGEAVARLGLSYLLA